MEKRALLAFALSMAVLFLWEVYFTPQPARKAESPAVSETATEPKRESSTAPSSSFAGSEASRGVDWSHVPQQHAATVAPSSKSWVVDTPLYTARVAAAGGRIESFTLKKHRQSVDPSAPPMDLIPSKGMGYLPLAVDLLHHKEWPLATMAYDGDAPTEMRLNPGDGEKALILSAEVPGIVRVQKILRFSADTYAVKVEVSLTNLSEAPLTDQLGISSYAMPFEGLASSYNQSHVTVLKNGSLEHFNQKALKKDTPILKPPVHWVGFDNNYFLQAVVPAADQHFQVAARLLDAGSGLVQLVYLTDPFTVDPGATLTVSNTYYWGPKEQDALKRGDVRLERALDFGWFSFLAKPLLMFLRWIYNYTHNYGVAIIILTVIIKILFWPLTHKSFKSMQVMKKIQPKMAQIREKYKDDREKLNQELMMLYRTYKVNPLGGCLPIVLQIPVFFALYRMLYGAIELRHQPFWLWINDLTAPDRLSVGFEVPYLGGLPVLTLLMGASMFIQQKMTPSAGDPRQEKLMLMMPVIFTVFFINFPSGLVLYWFVNNVLSIVQQYWINRQA
ncbi:membrane protein insertase YidC [Desulfosoma caldarium]|uniref:Membrane protein insertase YidC n=1 Tax=Desulfosoma caldarium TaxID=610254 RepID=A0A3N1VR43_9BACT|nr:membrane protein insertase YidC [Desulfosoma caldarium]ROR03551.1 protein translocase subunit yidC [Desulfosoma caldarium]